MIEQFNGIIYLIIFVIHFLGFGVYAYQMIINNKNFRKIYPYQFIGKGKNVREWTFVKDTCRAIEKSIKNFKKDQVYNIGSGFCKENIFHRLKKS